MLCGESQEDGRKQGWGQCIVAKRERVMIASTKTSTINHSII